MGKWDINISDCLKRRGLVDQCNKLINKTDEVEPTVELKIITKSGMFITLDKAVTRDV